MSIKSEDITRLPSSPRLIPAWKDLKLLIKNILKDVKAGGKPKDKDVRVLSDWPKTVYKEFHQPQFSTFICFYSINVNYFVSLNWMEPSTKEMKAVLWIQEGDAEMKRILKQKFHVLDQVPPIQAMVHTGPRHMLIAYCDDVCLRLFGDHQRAFTLLGTVPCHFFISCLCFDSETEVLLSGTMGAVVTWFILPNGSGLQMAQTVSMPDHEFVQGFSLNSPQGSILAFCENKVRVFTHQGQGQLKEVKQFSPLSGSTITCSFTCVPRGYFYAGNKDGEIHVWGLAQGNFLHSFQAHSSSVVCIHSRPDTHTLLTAGAEGLVKEWNLAFGNLLRQLPIHEGLRRLQFIDNTTFFCQTGCSFSLHHLPYFYSLFHVCGSAPQQMQRVCCGRNWTRILCATKDGLLRFLSPVTGELLVITWPLQVTEKAKVWAYDSAREELFVATHSPEVLVFDATRSPCPVKYLVRTSVKPWDRVRCLAYVQSHLGKGLEGLMFCGHDSGIVRILSHYSCARIEKTLHTGAVLALSTLERPQKNPLLCSYGIDKTLYLTEAVLQENKVTLKPVIKILCGCSLKHVILLPDSVGAITGNHCWRLWHFQDFIISSRSKQTSIFQETKSLHHCAIASFDVCFSLRLFVTAGTDGRVRLWNFQGRLLTELKSALQFGPLCFANNRGDLLLTSNHSVYLVSCLKLLHHAELTLLSTLDSADEIQEVPKPFLPSFFFSFRTVNVPKFVYLEQGLQEFRGLEALVNKRVIAFDNIVPHVVEEETRVSYEIQEQPKLHFVEDKDPNLSSVDVTWARPPHTVPAQLQITGWDGISPYYVLQKFFGKRRHWPITPDGYIPNSVIRARLWPEGTPIVLHCGVDPVYRGKDRDLDEIFKHARLLMTTLAKKSKQKYKVASSPQAYSVILEKLIKRNWIGRQFNDEFVSNLIEIILNLTTSCSVEKFKKYINVLEKLFALYPVPSGLQMQAVCRLLEDTADSNPQIRALSWEGLERLGFTSHLFAVPLAMGLMDRDKNVRDKVLYHFIKVTGIESKTMLLALLRKEETLQELQQKLIGEFSLDQLLGIDAEAIQLLIARVEQCLNENLTLSHPSQHLLNVSEDGKLEVIGKQTLGHLIQPEGIDKLKERIKYIEEKSRKLIQEGRRLSQKQEELIRAMSAMEHPKDEEKKREMSKSMQMDTRDVVLEPEPPLTILSPVESQEDTKSQHDVKPRDRREYMKSVSKSLIKKELEKVARLLKKKKKSRASSETTAEEPTKEVTQVIEPEGTRKKPLMHGHGMAGVPGQLRRPKSTSWRGDICSLITSRISSSQPGMLRNLNQELVDLAQMTLAPRAPSWALFQEICPLLKESSKSDDRIVEESPVTTEKVVEEAVEEEERVELKEKRDEKESRKGKAFSEIDEKKEGALLDLTALEQRKIEKEIRKPAGQEEITVKETKPSKLEKLTQGEENLMDGEENMPWEEILLASPQEKLTEEEQRFVPGGKQWTEEEERLLKKRASVTWKEGEPALKRKGLDREEEEALGEEEEGLEGEGEEQAWDEEELFLDTKEQAEERRKDTWDVEKDVEEEENLSREEKPLFGGKERQALKRDSSAEQILALAQEKIKWLAKMSKAIHKKKYDHQKKTVGQLGKKGQKERQVKKKEEKKKLLVGKKKKLGLEEEEKLGIKERLAQKGVTPSQEEVRKARDKQRRALEEGEMAMEKRQQALAEKRADQKEARWTGKVEKATEEKKQWAREGKKLVPGAEKKREKIEKVSPKEGEQAMGKGKEGERGEKQRRALEEGETAMEKRQQALAEKRADQKEARWTGKVKKATEEKKQWAREGKKLGPGAEKEREKIEKVSPKEGEQAMGKGKEGERGEKQRRALKEGEMAMEKRQQALAEKRADEKEERRTGEVKAAEEKKQWVREGKKLVPGAEKEREKIEKVSPKEGEQAMGKGKEGERGEKQRRALEEGETAMEKRQQALAEKRADEKEERQTGEVEKAAEEKKQWAREEKKLVPDAEKEREKIEKVSPKEGEQAMGKGKEGERGEKQRRALEEGETAMEKRQQALAEKRADEKDERQTGEVEKAAEEKKQWAREGKELVPDAEKEREKIEKVSPKEGEQAMGKGKEGERGEKQRRASEEGETAMEKRQQALAEKKADEKEERWTGEVEKAAEEKKQWAREGKKLVPDAEKEREKIEKVSPKEGKQAMGKGKEGERGLRWVGKEKVIQERSQWAQGKKKLPLQEEAQAGGKENRLTQKDKEERRMTEKERAAALKEIRMAGRKKILTPKEKQIMKKDTLTQEWRKVASDTRTKEREAVKKPSKEERTEAMRTMDLKRGHPAEEKGTSSREKDMREQERTERVLRTEEKQVGRREKDLRKKERAERGFRTEEKRVGSRKMELRRKQTYLLKILTETKRETRTETLAEIPEEERALTGRSKTDGQSWPFFKEQEEITKEEKAGTGRKLDRLATKVRTPAAGESSEDQRLLRKVQEEMLLDKFEVEKVLKKDQEQTLLGKEQVKQLLRLADIPGKIQEKELLEITGDVLSESSSEHLLEKKTEEASSEKGSEEEGLGEEEETQLKEREKYSIKKKKKAHPSEEKLGDWAKRYKEGLTKEGEESVREEESLSEEEEVEKEEEVEEKEEKVEVEEKEEEMEEEKEGGEEEAEAAEVEEEEQQQKGVEVWSGEPEKERRLVEATRALKTEPWKAEVSSSKTAREGEILAEEKKDTVRGKMPSKKKRLLDGKRHPTLTDQTVPTMAAKSPLKGQLPEALGGGEGVLLKVSPSHLDLEGQESQLGAHFKTRQEEMLLEKARGMFSQVPETGLEAPIPESLQKFESHLPPIIIKPLAPEGGRWKWFLKTHGFPVGETEGQAPAPTPAPSPSLPSTSAKQSLYSEEDWLKNTLRRLAAGKQLSRDNFHRLSQLLRNITSKGHLKGMHLCILKAIAGHLAQNLEVRQDISQPWEAVLSPVHLKVTSPIRRKEQESWRELFPSLGPVLPAITKRPQAPQVLRWPLLVESYRKQQALQLSATIKELAHFSLIRKATPTVAYPSVIKDFGPWRGREELPKFAKAKKKSLPITAPLLPATTRRSQALEALSCQLLGEAYRSARAQQRSHALQEMERRHFDPATRDFFSTDAHALVEKQTLALMFQKDLRAFKGKGRPHKLPKLEKKAQPLAEEAVPPWETFVALYYILQMLQEQYAKDSTGWMEQFHQLMDLYQVKSPRVQSLLLELLQRKKGQSKENIYKNGPPSKDLVPGERVFYSLICGGSHAPREHFEFQNVVPLPEKNSVHSIQPVGIAQYGFLELAWKSLPQVNPYPPRRLPNIPARTL